MTFSELSDANIERCESDATGFAHRLKDWRPSQWSNAMAGETGEVCNITKKIDRILDGSKGNKPGDRDMNDLVGRAALEVGDVVIYADLLARRLGVSLESCVRAAFNEKSKEIGSPIRL